MRVIALLATYNEERFIAACLEHLFHQGIEVYLIDNQSSDGTVAIAKGYLGRGLIGIETLPRFGMYRWRPILKRKEQLAAQLKGDWFMHVDADEIRLPPFWSKTVPDALAIVDAQGYNAVNFMEFTFVPTQEAPDHDHGDFQKTMRWYYPFLPAFPHRLNLWKQPAGSVQLAWSGGHKVRFSGLRLYPESFPMKHYLFLSVPHAIEKYVKRHYDPAEVARGWHRARAGLKETAIKLPSQAELRHCATDEQLDPNRPHTRHLLFQNR